MYKATEVCSGTSEQFIAAEAPPLTGVRAESKAQSGDHALQGLECRAKAFGLVHPASKTGVEGVCAPKNMIWCAKGHA